jgi:hypothetical protein
MTRMLVDRRPWNSSPTNNSLKKNPGLLPTQMPRGLFILRNAYSVLCRMNLSPPLPPSSEGSPSEE